MIKKTFLQLTPPTTGSCRLCAAWEKWTGRREGRVENRVSEKLFVERRGASPPGPFLIDVATRVLLVFFRYTTQQRRPRPLALIDGRAQLEGCEN